MKYIIAVVCAVLLGSADRVFAQPQPPHPNADFTVRVVENKLPSQVTLQWHNQDVVVLCRVRGNGQNLEVSDVYFGQCSIGERSGVGSKCVVT